MARHAVLHSETHRALRIRTDAGAALGDAVMTCIVVPDEFRRVQNDYPILFQLDPTRDSFGAVALFGFERGENLFLEGDRWDARSRPLAMAIQPFLIGRASADDHPAQVHIDLDSPRVGDAEGVRLFDEDGRASPYLDDIAGKLGELHEGYQRSGDFFAMLRRHELLEPLTLDITLADGATNRLIGFHAIDEDRLQALDAGALAELHDGGQLMPLFMALASLANIDALVRRKNRRLGHG